MSEPLPSFLHLVGGYHEQAPPGSASHRRCSRDGFPMPSAGSSGRLALQRRSHRCRSPRSLIALQPARSQPSRRTLRGRLRGDHQQHPRSHRGRRRGQQRLRDHGLRVATQAGPREPDVIRILCIPIVVLATWWGVTETNPSHACLDGAIAGASFILMLVKPND
jgi:hypothetical protein